MAATKSAVHCIFALGLFLIVILLQKKLTEELKVKASLIYVSNNGETASNTVLPQYLVEPNNLSQTTWLRPIS